MGIASREGLIVASKRKLKRKPSVTRVVGYRFEGDIDVVSAMKLLARALSLGLVTQFDSTKSMERGKDVVWFNGPPGRPLRSLRAQITALRR